VTRTRPSRWGQARPSSSRDRFDRVAAVGLRAIANRALPGLRRRSRAPRHDLSRALAADAAADCRGHRSRRRRRRTDRALPLSDRLSSATAGRPRGCSPRPAATLSSPEPRVWNVAKAIADSAAGSRTEGVVRSAIAGRPLLGGRRSRRRRQADDSYPLIPSARVGASVVTSASVGLSALTLLCTVEGLAGRNLCPRRRPSSAPKLDPACVLPYVRVRAVAPGCSLAPVACRLATTALVKPTPGARSRGRGC